jgi:8-oxo-dGTP diphosphatase
MRSSPRTHRLAVAAYVFRGDQVLLLRRAHPPRAFAPPGGHLEPDEKPQTGLKREVREETGLEIEILGIANVWYGSIDGEQPPLLCINFIARAGDGRVALSDEHSEFRWVTRREIENGEVGTMTDTGLGYRPEGILDAFDKLADSHRLAPMLP